MSGCRVSLLAGLGFRGLDWSKGSLSDVALTSEWLGIWRASETLGSVYLGCSILFLMRPRVSSI